jgi:hypothetical protein
VAVHWKPRSLSAPWRMEEREKDMDEDSKRRLWAVLQTPGPPGTSTDREREQSLWILGGTLVACLRPSGPSPPPKDARFGRLACLCRPGLVHSVPPVQCQPLEFPAYELSEVWLRCCLYPGRHICADGPALDLASGGQISTFVLFPSSVGHSLRFFPLMQQQQQQQQQDTRTL